jgi:mannose-6-phosphate isomerase
VIEPPISFEPIFFSRPWGGRSLESFYGKRIPAKEKIGESWEIVDRAEAQSIVPAGKFAGRSLHELWVNYRDEVFGHIADAPRFPLLLKLLDCREALSLQVHPSVPAATLLAGEPKTECWFIADAKPGAELYLGLRRGIDRNKFAEALVQGTVADCVHRIPVRTGEAFMIPSGRLHAIGAGNLIVEVQQNSDTTYRVWDWNRRDETGKERELHIDQALQCIDFSDHNPAPIELDRSRIIAPGLFDIERIEVVSPHELVSPGSFAILFCLKGDVRCGDAIFRPGEFFLLGADSAIRRGEPVSGEAAVLRITVPASDSLKG